MLILTIELREVSAALYNLLKSHKAPPMSASSLINRLQLNDEVLETNLSTTLQTMHEMTQFWLKKEEKIAGAWCLNLAVVQSTTLMTLLTTSKLSTMCLKAMTWESCRGGGGELVDLIKEVEQLQVVSQGALIGSTYRCCCC